MPSNFVPYRCAANTSHTKRRVLGCKFEYVRLVALEVELFASQPTLHTYIRTWHAWKQRKQQQQWSIKIQHAIVVVVAVAVVVEYDDEFKSDKTDRMKTEHSSLVINAKMPSAILRITHEENVVRANEHICFCCLQLLNTHSVWRFDQFRPLTNGYN